MWLASAVGERLKIWKSSQEQKTFAVETRNCFLIGVLCWLVERERVLLLLNVKLINKFNSRWQNLWKTRKNIDETSKKLCLWQIKLPKLKFIDLSQHFASFLVRRFSFLIWFHLGKTWKTYLFDEFSFWVHKLKISFWAKMSTTGLAFAIASNGFSRRQRLEAKLFYENQKAATVASPKGKNWLLIECELQRKQEHLEKYKPYTIYTGPCVHIVYISGVDRIVGEKMRICFSHFAHFSSLAVD